MVKGKTKSGIKFSIDENIKDDADLLLLLAEVQDERADMQEKQLAIKDLLWLIFGESRDAVYDFTKEVKRIHGNRSFDSITAELSDIFEALSAKNSSSSPQ